MPLALDLSLKTPSMKLYFIELVKQCFCLRVLSTLGVVSMQYSEHKMLEVVRNQLEQKTLCAIFLYSYDFTNYF